MLTVVPRTSRSPFLCSLPSHRSQWSHLIWRGYHSPTPTKSQASLTAPSGKHKPDPFSFLAPQLSELRLSLLSLLESGHPHLTEMTKYYLLRPSKQIRPLTVLLFSLATNGLGSMWAKKHREATNDGMGNWRNELDVALSPQGSVLNDWSLPVFPTRTAQVTQELPVRFPASHQPQVPTSTQPPTPPEDRDTGRPPPSLAFPHAILPTQNRLAQIVEMMHTASLLHDDVIDKSALRRGSPSAPAAFGNKFSILGGNFLLGRVLGMISHLGDLEAMDLVTSVLSDLVDGEILQMKGLKAKEEWRPGEKLDGVLDELGGHSDRCKAAWNVYLQKTYLKTASLMARGAKAAVTLGGCKEGDVWREIAFAYGRDLGMAFQLVDDVLDYDSQTATLGKPGGVDLQLGLATGPTLFAWENHPKMGDLIQRKFERPGDVERALDFVNRSSAVRETRKLAQRYADKAKQVLMELPESDAKAGLEVLAERVMIREW